MSVWNWRVITFNTSGGDGKSINCELIKDQRVWGRKVGKMGKVRKIRKNCEKRGKMRKNQEIQGD
jgi:hypothetical protein